MLAFRLFRPVFKTATRDFTANNRPQASPTYRTTQRTFVAWSKKRPNNTWQSTFRRAQHRQYRRQAFNYQRFQQSQDLFRRWAAQPTFYYQVGGIGLLCGGYYIYNLEEVPVSGRRRFRVTSYESEKAMGQQQYQQTLQEFGKKIMPESTQEHRMVRRVLDRLIPHSGLQGEEWTVHVIDDPMKNAFVIPGGHVFVFRGILDICEGDDGLAAVLGHEIAHNVAHHMAERLSQMYIFLPVTVVVSALAGVDFSIINTAQNLLVSLPGSRKQEEEADYVGLMMMAESCYNPEAAVGLWARMEKEEQMAPPQFLSTHPSSHNRLGKIRGWLPDAEKKFEEGDCGITAGYVGGFQQAVGGFQRW